MQSLQIVPVETAAGKHPEIVGTIKASSAKAAGETTEVNVIASLVRPDHSVKSWTWKKISIKAGDSKSFSIPKEYDAKMQGVYKVDFGVYSKDMRPLHRLSKTFTVVDQSRTRSKTTSPQIVTRGTGTSSGKQHAVSSEAWDRETTTKSVSASLRTWLIALGAQRCFSGRSSV